MKNNILDAKILPFERLKEVDEKDVEIVNIRKSRSYIDLSRMGKREKESYGKTWFVIDKEA